MKPHYYDGMRLADSSGRLFRVFEPRWWELSRWLLLLRYRFGWLRDARGQRISVGHLDVVSNNDTVLARVVGTVRIR